MGIKGLRQLLEAKAPESMKDRTLKDYYHKRIAMDASISIYQCMTSRTLHNDKGEETSHIHGIWLKTVCFLKAGIEPIYVFDGPPPDMKQGELAKRDAKRDAAKKELDRREAEKKDVTRAVQDGDKNKDTDEDLRKRTLKVTRKHYDECKRLLKLMGVPVVQAASEAEAECSHLCKHNQVYSVASEDTDCLPFGALRVLMNFKCSDKGKEIKEVDSVKVLEKLKLNMDEFIDLCILCGCDYCGTIEDIKGEEALKLIHEHGSIEAILVNKASNQCPDNWLYKEAHQLFKKPKVNSHVPSLQWTTHDTEGLIKFLVTENNFSKRLVDHAIKNIETARKEYNNNTIYNYLEGIPKDSEEGTASNKPAIEMQDSKEGTPAIEMQDSKEGTASNKKKKQRSIFDYVERIPKDSEGPDNKKPKTM